MEYFALIVSAVVLWLVFNLRSRVRRLEDLFPGSQKVHPPAQAARQRTPESSDKIWAAKTRLVQTQTGPDALGRFVEWLKEDWLLKLGALLLIIGFGWLATYAFLNNWIGPMGRVTLGLVAGAIFILFGWWRMRKYINQGGIFLVLGSTTVLLTVFAARMIYDFFTPATSLGVMFLSTAFVALASVKYNNRALALLSLALAGAAPLLTKSPDTDHIGLFAYLLIVTVGAIWVVALTAQRGLTAAALVIISLYSAPHLFAPWIFPSADNSKLLLFAYAFAALFFLANVVGIIKNKNNKIIIDFLTAAGNGLFLLAWIMMVSPEEWKSLLISAWMVVFVAGAFLFFKVTARREPFYVYAGVGVAMLAAATFAELKGAPLTIAYTVETVLVAVTAYWVTREIKMAKRASWLLIGPAILSISSLTSGAWDVGVINKDFFVLLILGLALFGMGLFLAHFDTGPRDPEKVRLFSVFLIAGSIYAYALLWLSLRAGMESDNVAVMISLAVYTVIGLAAYFYGMAKGLNGLRVYGGALVGFVVGRLLLVDIWKMELVGRITTFFLIGALLVSTAFLGGKKQAPDLTKNL